MFPACTDFGKKGKIVVKFTAEEAEAERTFSIEQDPCIRFGIGNLGSEEMYTAGERIGVNQDNWPFLTPVYSYIPSTAASAKDKGKEVKFSLLTGYDMYVYSTNGLWKNGTTGWMFGGAAGNYLQLPVLSGKALRKIIYCFRGVNAFKGKVQKPDGTILVSSFATGGQGSVTSINVNASAPGDTCRIVANGTVNFQIGEMSLYYE